MASPQNTFDYIIVGGGTAGCVLASRLRQAFPSLSIALIEAGEDATANPMVVDPRAAQALHETEFEWKYTSTPQVHLDGRTLPNWGGKTLSGSSAVNYTAWTRGHAADYDRWAAQVNDKRWSYESLLPAFKRSEHYHDTSSEAVSVHGFDGAIRTHSGDFGFPLREPVKDAFQSVGLESNRDMNSGNPNGIAPLVLNWHELKRQHAASCYDLSGVHVMCNSLVSKVLFDDTGRATGVLLANNKGELQAKKEVILSCGAIRTPQVLLLSGIGPKQELEKHSIRVQVDQPYVGKNLRDHHAVTMFWKFKQPERGLAFPSPGFNKPSFADSLPMDWFITGAAPHSDLEKAAAIDGTELEAGPRSDFEVAPMYLTNGAVPSPWLPFDGNYISVGTMGLSTTSKGSITLNSTDPFDSPIIDPNALSTAHDFAVIRAGMRLTIDAMSSAAMEPYVEPNEVPPPGLTALSKDSTDAEFDAHIKALAFSWFHAAGTAAMGTVVDSECRVKGVQGLRVVDASVFPVNIAAHLQAPVYALAEQAATIIAASTA